MKPGALFQFLASRSKNGEVEAMERALLGNNSGAKLDAILIGLAEVKTDVAWHKTMIFGLWGFTFFLLTLILAMFGIGVI